jgi:hypothetical protein
LEGNCLEGALVVVIEHDQHIVRDSISCVPWVLDSGLLLMATAGYIASYNWLDGWSFWQCSIWGPV